MIDLLIRVASNLGRTPNHAEVGQRTEPKEDRNLGSSTSVLSRECQVTGDRRKTISSSTRTIVEAVFADWMNLSAARSICAETSTGTPGTKMDV